MNSLHSCPNPPAKSILATLALTLLLFHATPAFAQRGGDGSSSSGDGFARGGGLFGDNLTLDSSDPFVLVRDAIGGANDFYSINPNGDFLEMHTPSTRTNSALLAPFRMYFEAAPAMLTVDDPGVLIGSANNAQPPAATLHVLANPTEQMMSSVAEAKILVENRGLSSAPRTMIEMSNPGGSRFGFTNPDSGRTWTFQTNPSDNFLINLLGSGGNEFSVRKTGRVTMGPGGTLNFVLDEVGNLTVLGTVTPMSDRNLKKDFEKIDTRDVLQKISELPITTWQYKRDLGVLRHIGPMAQDFHAAFGVGKDDKTISVTDAAGVSLAGIKALNQRCDELVAESAEKDEVIQELESRLDELIARMNALETLIPN